MTDAADPEGTRPAAAPDLDPAAVNKRVEALWRAGEIDFRTFDWWLRTVNGV